jgi:hypothetical protein
MVQDPSGRDDRLAKRYICMRINGYPEYRSVLQVRLYFKLSIAEHMDNGLKKVE